MKNLMKKALMTLVMLPFLASAPALAAGTAGLLHMAQAADPRVSQMQEQMRELMGRVEELNFQILQMQEEMRKMQEDNEFRFQELEKSKRSDAGSGSKHASTEPVSPAIEGASQDASHHRSTTTQEAASAATSSSSSADSVAIDQTQADRSQHASAPHDLGSIRFDANGNVIGAEVTPDQSAQPAGNLAALPQVDDPNALYNAAYQYLLSGDYRTAEAGFRQHIDRYPADPMTADARFWYGETLYAQKRYREAATVFIDNEKEYPDSKRNAENMLKLGMTMVQMDNHDVACATFSQIPSRYPQASEAVLKRVQEEREKNRC